jgi:hypothetical protein
MIKPPQVYGLILCEDVRVDIAPPRFCLDGLFLGREFSSFPTARLAFMVYVALFGGRGEGVMELACMELESEQDIYYHRRWVAFSEPAKTIHYMISVKKIIFPNAGRYRFPMSFDKEAFAIRYLDIRQARR